MSLMYLLVLKDCDAFGHCLTFLNQFERCEVIERVCSLFKKISQRWFIYEPRLFLADWCEWDENYRSIYASRMIVKELVVDVNADQLGDLHNLVLPLSSRICSISRYSRIAFDYSKLPLLGSRLSCFQMVIFDKKSLIWLCSHSSITEVVITITRETQISSREVLDFLRKNGKVQYVTLEFIFEYFFAEWREYYSLI